MNALLLACPPHRYQLPSTSADGSYLGVCKRCGAVKEHRPWEMGLGMADLGWLKDRRPTKRAAALEYVKGHPGAFAGDIPGFNATTAAATLQARLTKGLVRKERVGKGRVRWWALEVEG